MLYPCIDPKLQLIELSRLTREQLDKLSRWHLELLDAGQAPVANKIIVDCAREMEQSS